MCGREVACAASASSKEAKMCGREEACAASASCVHRRRREPERMIRSPLEGDEAYDPFKHSAARYLGYANELGESFRPLIHHRWVLASYGVACSYVVADCVDKYWRASTGTGRKTLAERRMIGASRAIDTAIWQGLASVAIPGLVINRIVWSVGKLPLPPSGRLLPTVVGLASIPFIVSPIDAGVHRLADLTYKPALKKTFGDDS